MTATRDRDFTTEDITRNHGTRCALCHLSIDMMLSHPHRGMFTIDHIIPLADGGPDTLENVQPAHYACNSRRGRKRTVTAEQMRQPPSTTRKPKKTIRTRPRPCANCGTEFQPNGGRTTCCSTNCNTIYRNPPSSKICKGCAGRPASPRSQWCQHCNPRTSRAPIGQQHPCRECHDTYTKRAGRQLHCEPCIRARFINNTANKIHQCPTCTTYFHTLTPTQIYCFNPCTNKAGNHGKQRTNPNQTLNQQSKV